MENTDHISSHDRFAATYDEQAKEFESHGHDILFGLCYEYINSGDSILDLGIGTGLSSANFAKAGLSVTGLDGSSGMLEECRKKGFATELKQYDITGVPFPYPENSFSHVICCGVFHFFGDLVPIIEEVCRILKPGGVFAFATAFLTEEEAGGGQENIPDHKTFPTAWGISIYKHSDRYIKQIAETLRLTILKQQKVLIFSGDKNAGDILFKGYVVRKGG